MNLWFWVWIAVAAVMLIAEVAQPTSFYWPWAVGSAAAGGLDAAGYGVWSQWAAFVLVPSTIVVVVTRLKRARARGAGAEDDV